MGKQNHPINNIGTRHGEKLFETLCSREEMLTAINEQNYFRIPSDKRELNYDKYFVEGSEKLSNTQEYNSHNTQRLDIHQMKQTLLTIDNIDELLIGAKDLSA